MKLSTNETKVWTYLLGYLTDHDYAPTYSEIALQFNWTKQYAKQVVDGLKEKGKITIRPLKHRGIEIK